jgi:hypothetical protein
MKLKNKLLKKIVIYEQKKNPAALIFFVFIYSSGLISVLKVC